ncbi:hypothetical protein D3C73_855020 [compost metagenome]
MVLFRFRQRRLLHRFKDRLKHRFMARRRCGRVFGQRPGLLVLTPNERHQQQQGDQCQQTDNQQPVDAFGLLNRDRRRYCLLRSGHRCRLDFRQTGLQFGDLFFLCRDLFVLGLQPGVQLIDGFLQLLVAQLAGGQLLGRFIHQRSGRRSRLRGGCRFFRRRGRGGSRRDTWKRGVRGAGVRLIGNRYDARRTRWIDQHRVFAKHTSIRLIDLDEKIEKRLSDGLTGTHANQVAIAAQDWGEFKVVEKEYALYAGTTEFIRCRQADRQVALLQSCHIFQGDIGAKRLVQRRTHGDIPQPQRGRQCRVRH